jgi:Tol biopolymer transport system component
MEAGGSGFITAVGTNDSTVWLHDPSGDHQLSVEGNAMSPNFSENGKSLYFLMSRGESLATELWKKDLESGKVESVLPDEKLEPPSVGPHNGYAVSPDEKLVAFARKDDKGRSNLWVAPTNHRTAPRQLASQAVEDSPLFLSNDEIAFRAVENGLNFLYRVKADGSGRTKLSPDRIFDVQAGSPDGRWIVAMVPSEDPEQAERSRLYATDTGKSYDLCSHYCWVDWNASGTLFYIQAKTSDAVRALPVLRETGLPKIPPGGFSDTEVAPKSARAINAPISCGLSATVYAFVRQNTRRNLYRIPIP